MPFNKATRALAAPLAPTTARLSVLLLALGLAPAASAQGFSSGSDGSDGALAIAGGQGVVNFDPAALGVDADGDRREVEHPIAVGAGTTVRLSGNALGLGKPVHWVQLIPPGSLTGIPPGLPGYPNDIRSCNGSSNKPAEKNDTPTNAAIVVPRRSVRNL